MISSLDVKATASREEISMRLIFRPLPGALSLFGDCSSIFL